MAEEVFGICPDMRAAVLHLKAISDLVVPTIKNGEELCIRVTFSFFFFLFHAKSGTTNNHWIRFSDISYENPYSRDSNHIKTF